MKKNNLLLIAAILFGGLLTVQAQNKAQQPPYLNEIAFMQAFEAKATQIIANDKFITPQEAEKQLKEVEGKVVKIKRTKPNQTTLSRKEIYNNLLQSFVVFGNAFDCGHCDAVHIQPMSGYIIDEDGLCVTNHHVIESFVMGKEYNHTLVVSLANGNAYPVVEVLSSDKDADLAIVRLDTRGDKLTPLPLGNPAEVADDIYILSNPYNNLFYFSEGMVARNHVRTLRHADNKLMPEMEVTADFAVGSSGAPVVDNKGNLVATVATTRSIYYNARDMTDLQMVIKGTLPVMLLEQMITFE